MQPPRKEKEKGKRKRGAEPSPTAPSKNAERREPAPDICAVSRSVGQKEGERKKRGREGNASKRLFNILSCSSTKWGGGGGRSDSYLFFPASRTKKKKIAVPRYRFREREISTDRLRLRRDRRGKEKKKKRKHAGNAPFCYRRGGERLMPVPLTT